MTDDEYRQLKEILKDSESCFRLSQWEEEFLSDMRGRVLVHRQSTPVSDKQWQVLRRVEEKVYRT